MTTKYSDIITIRGQLVVIDLYLVKFALGFGIKVNFLSAIGMFIALYIMKWSGER